MPDWLAIILYFSGVALLAAVPGLSVLALVSSSLANGMKTTAAAVCGAAIGTAALIALPLASQGAVNWLTTDSHALYVIVPLKLIMAVLLGFLAYRYWRGMESTGPALQSAIFLAVLSVALTNFATLIGFQAFHVIIGLDDQETTARWLIVSTEIVITALVLLAYAVLASRLRSFLRNKFAPKRIYQAAAVLTAWTCLGAVVR